MSRQRAWSTAVVAAAVFAGLVLAQREYENTGMHCKGEGVTDLMQWDHAQCSAYCDVREDCVGYVFNLKDNFTCILKGKSCELATSELWRFYRKPGSGGSGGMSHQAGGNSDWNADPGHSPAADHGYETHSAGGDDIVNGPPGNMGNSFTKRDFHCAGKNMGNGEPWSLSECAAQCLRQDKCIGFIRLITGDQQCILKEAGCSKKPPTVWVFYEKTDNGEVLPEGAAGAESAGYESAAASPVVAADAVGGYGVSPKIDEHFQDTQQHCKGGVISNEMRGHDQCSRACLDAPDCIGYSIATKDPYQCYLKSKECELSGHHPMWTFVRKKDLFREMRAVRCIKFAEEYGATSAEQCKAMCLERETFCVGVSFRSGSCKLITSFDCGGWQIFKKLAEDGTAGAAPPNIGGWQAAGIPETVSPSMIDLSPSEHVDHAPLGGELNDQMVDQDILMYFHKLNGNCRGGRYLDEVYGSEAECAGKCHHDERCRGFSYIRSEKRCTLKADACQSPNVVNPGVSFWIHLQRQ